MENLKEVVLDKFYVQKADSGYDEFTVSMGSGVDFAENILWGLGELRELTFDLLCHRSDDDFCFDYEDLSEQKYLIKIPSDCVFYTCLLIMSSVSGRDYLSPFRRKKVGRPSRPTNTH